MDGFLPKNFSLQLCWPAARARHSAGASHGSLSNRLFVGARWVIRPPSTLHVFDSADRRRPAFTAERVPQSIDWEKVDDAFGRKAAVSGDVHRYGFPRTDLNVTLDDVTVKPALALGGWVAFKPMGAEAMVMGDLVLLETEITSGDDQADRERHRNNGDTQSLASSPSDAVLHARRRAG